jgi:hypothetical protein
MCDACRVRDRSHPGRAGAPDITRPRDAPPFAAGLLGDERLGSAQLQVMRAGLARQVQHTAGNRTVGRILAREALKTGAEVDAMLIASTFFKPYVEPKHKAGTKADGNVHIHDAAAFKTEVLKYLKGKTNPKTNKEYTDAEAVEQEKTVRGFQDQATGQIHVHEKRGDSGTVVHEAMHLFASQKFVSAVGYHPNEGTTEIFTRKLCSANSIPRAGYPSQFASVNKVVALSSETMLADAYFDGKLQPVIDKIDAAKGAGTWAKWLAFMTAGKFTDADALL